MKFIKFGDNVISLENICFIEKNYDSVTITYHNKKSITQGFSTQKEAKNKIEEIYKFLKYNEELGE